MKKIKSHSRIQRPLGHPCGSVPNISNNAAKERLQIHAIYAACLAPEAGEWDKDNGGTTDEPIMGTIDSVSIK